MKSAGLLSHDPEPILYQTGYLTIKGYDEELEEYRLGYPNSEVEETFLNLLLPMYIGKEENREFSVDRFKRDVITGDVKGFMTRLSSLIASLPYTTENRSLETRFQDVVYMVFSFLGFYTHTEIHTSEGRIDVTVETSRNVYIFEFKIDTTASEAIAQIRKRHYWKRFEAIGKPILLIGATFDSRSRTLLDWECAKP